MSGENHAQTPAARTSSQIVRGSPTTCVCQPDEAQNSRPVIGGYRVAFTPPGNTCPQTINVRWLPTATSANTAAYASTINYPVEIRAN